MLRPGNGASPPLALTAIPLPLLTFRSEQLVAANQTALQQWDVSHLRAHIAFDDLVYNHAVTELQLALAAGHFDQPSGKLNLSSLVAAGKGQQGLKLLCNFAAIHGRPREKQDDAKGDEWWDAVAWAGEAILEGGSSICHYLLLTGRTQPHSVPISAPKHSVSRDRSPAKAADAPSPSFETPKSMRVTDLLEPLLDKDLAPVLDADQLKLVVDGISQMVFLSNVHGLVLYLNSAWYSYTGLSASDSVRPNIWADLFHPDDLQQAIEGYTMSLSTGKPIELQYRIRRHDGVFRWMLVRGRPVRDEAGNITSWISTITDVEEIVLLRREAVQREERFRAVLKGAGVLLLSLDLDGRIDFAEGLPGRSRDDLKQKVLGRPLAEVWGDRNLQDQVDAMLRDGDSLTVAHEAHPGALERTKAGVICVVTDVTVLACAAAAAESARLERDNLRARELAAQEANKLKTAFLMNISHELRTPLSAIVSIAELSLTDTTLTSSQRLLVEQSLASGETLLSLVGSILDLGKIEAGRIDLDLQPFDLRRDILNTVSPFQKAAERRGISFRVVLDIPNEGCLEGDSFRFSQVVTNALSNSLKFTDSGEISVIVHQEAENSGSWVWTSIAIQDSGIGIEEAVLSKLFTRFSQADASTTRKYGGSGLGLTIAKSLVELMGGTITLDSVFGEGSTVTVRVPFKTVNAVNPASANGKDMAAVSHLDPASYHVLLAEDNKIIRDVTCALLRKMKFHVVTVSNGHDAIAAIEAKDFDLVLMDDQMPELSGTDATRLVRRSTVPRVRDVKIIALTASAIAGDEARLLSAGMDGYVAKPYRAEALRTAMLDMIQRPRKDPVLDPIS